jgi:hypothetical protein
VFHACMYRQACICFEKPPEKFLTDGCKHVTIWHTVLESDVGRSYKVLCRKPARSRPLGRPMCRQKNTAKTDFMNSLGTVWTGSLCLRMQSHDCHV